MRKNKKAMESTTLVLFILVVVVALSLIGVAMHYSSLATKDVRKRACEWDINKAALSKKLPDIKKLFMPGERLTSLNNCRRDNLGNLVIKYSDVVENGLINQNKASKIIAEEMAECWKMVGQGKIDPFSNWDNTDTSFCMACTTIKFDKKLGEYYLESLTNKNTFEKRKENGVIRSPIQWMAENDYVKGKTYYEFIYHSKPQFTNEDYENMDKNFIIEDTMITLKLYKFEDKNMWKVIASWGAIIAGGLLVVIGVGLSLTGAGAVIGAPLAAIGLKISIAGVAITAGVILLATGSVGMGIVMFDPVNLNPYSECEECNGVGSLKIIPPVFDISTPVEIKYPTTLTVGKEVVEKGPYCSIVVN